MVLAALYTDLVFKVSQFMLAGLVYRMLFLGRGISCPPWIRLWRSNSGAVSRAIRSPGFLGLSARLLGVWIILSSPDENSQQDGEL